MGKFTKAKQVALAYIDALESCEVGELAAVIAQHVSPDYQMRSVYPFRELTGAKEAAERVWGPMRTALSSMQRRQDIFIAGDNKFADEVWVMSMGHFVGLFDREWLGIRPTGKMASLRFVEFICVEDGKIKQTCLHLDLIGLMQQAGAYPLPPSTAQYFTYPGPKRHNGLLFEDAPEAQGKDTLDLVGRMCDDLVDGGLVSEADEEVDAAYTAEVYGRTFSPKMTWYGPCGIGATYTIQRYIAQHQGPFSEGLTDMRFVGHRVRFAEGGFACWFGWPNLRNRNKGGYLGLPEGKEPAEMYVVDVYSCENGMIEENWVFIDLPWWLKQQGLDIFDRTQKILNPKEEQLV